MKNREYYISLFFSLMFIIGISFSALHSHDAGYTESENGNAYTLDHKMCVICGSVFKADNSAAKPVNSHHYPEIYFYSTRIADASPEFGSFFDRRAPPFFS